MIESDVKGRDLCCLRALPLPDDYSEMDLPAWLAERPVLTADGFAPATKPFAVRLLRSYRPPVRLSLVAHSRLANGGAGPEEVGQLVAGLVRDSIS